MEKQRAPSNGTAAAKKCRATLRSSIAELRHGKATPGAAVTRRSRATSAWALYSVARGAWAKCSLAKRAMPRHREATPRGSGRRQSGPEHREPDEAEEQRRPASQRHREAMNARAKPFDARPGRSRDSDGERKEGYNEPHQPHRRVQKAGCV